MDKFPPLDKELLESLLEPPEDVARLLIDTDAANEIDDQYALAWALLSPEHMQIEAITAEPYSFAHHRKELLAIEQSLEQKKEAAEHLVGGFQGWVQRVHAQGRRVDSIEFVDTAEGMERSYQEILTIYEKLGIPSEGKVYRGATHYMEAADKPVLSESVECIIDLAKSGSSTLYIAAMGCVTNIASALVLAPEIRENIVIIWTSAYPSHAPQCNRPSLNLVQDVHASRLLFDSGAAHVYLPGYHVGAQLKISLPEMQAYVRGRGAIGDYLYHLYTHNPLHDMFALSNTEQRTWVIWDVICIAWLINPAWVPSMLTTTPVLDEELYWRTDNSRHMMREAHDVQRDEIFLHFYEKLAAAKA